MKKRFMVIEETAAGAYTLINSEPDTYLNACVLSEQLAGNQIYHTYLIVEFVKFYKAEKPEIMSDLIFKED